MTGFCPAGPEVFECYPGPKWTPNDPMFYLHHAVSFTPPPSVLITPDDRFPFQMIDRLWTQWQLVSQQNARSFGGGSVPERETLAEYRAFPNGGPPFVHVRPVSPNAYHPSLVFAQFGSVLPSDGLWEDVSIFDVMDTRNENLCYTYE